MSWDVFAQDFPDVKSISDISDDYVPKTIGKRQELIQKIQEVVPFADFSDPSWGTIDTEVFSIEVNMGDGDDIECIAFHIRGSSGGGACIAEILRHLGLKAIDTGTGDFFDFSNPEYGFDKWRAFKNKCMGK